MQLNYIANTLQASFSGLLIPMLDPSDGQVFNQIQCSNAADIDAAVRAAQDCLQRHWRQLSAVERGRLLMQLSRKITEHVEELAAIVQNAGQTCSAGSRLLVEESIYEPLLERLGAGSGIELPFGGVKSSGYGRKKGFEALHGFTSHKTVAFKHD